MPRRFPSVCSMVFSTAALALSMYGLALRGQTPAPKAHIAVPLNAVSLLSIQCKANPVSVLVGETVTIGAQGTSLQGLPLQYSFTTTAGQLEQKGSAAVLHTNGLAPQVVHVVCNVADSQGHRESQGIAVTVMAAKVESETIHRLPTARPAPTATPPPPPPVEIPASRPAAPAPGPTHTESSQSPPQPAQPDTKPVASSPPTTAPTKAETSPPAEREGARQTAQPGPTATAATPPDEYQQSQSVEQWVDHLRQGKIEYKIPSRMTTQAASTVTVVIHGYQDVGSTTLSSATGSGALKQSERMKVELLAPENPGAFTITAQDGDSVRFVPINGTTTWMWAVTPNTAGDNLQLEVRASVIYPGGSDRTEQQVETYEAKVAVAVQPFWSTAYEYVREHPLQVAGYLIPGGAGFAFLSGLAVWWWNRRQKDKTADKATVPPTKPQRRRGR
ncbi:MAG TPA: hypothetical protein VF214_09975 [Edaphobacter sp.]